VLVAILPLAMATASLLDYRTCVLTLSLAYLAFIACVGQTTHIAGLGRGVTLLRFVLRSG
jgi:hypothetical protein